MRFPYIIRCILRALGIFLIPLMLLNILIVFGCIIACGIIIAFGSLQSALLPNVVGARNSPVILLFENAVSQVWSLFLAYPKLSLIILLFLYIVGYIIVLRKFVFRLADLMNLTGSEPEVSDED